ncbi:MAG: hypothetical protein ACI4MS_06360 [Candidatus Coproplasma sp.]
MTKKKFSQPEIEVVNFDCKDVITSSNLYSTNNIFEDISNLYDVSIKK